MGDEGVWEGVLDAGGSVEVGYEIVGCVDVVGAKGGAFVGIGAGEDGDVDKGAVGELFAAVSRDDVAVDRGVPA